MTPEDQTFFSSALSAGAILTGFCGTFLSFRIQREANYYRQPALDYGTGTARDIKIDLSHFSSSFLILIIASIVTMIFGFVLPLLILAQVICAVSTNIVAGGLLCGLALICGYFLIELRHYNIVSNKLVHDKAEWGRQSLLVVASVFVAVVIFVIVGFGI